MTESLLKVEGLGVTEGRRVLLDNVSMQIDPGEIVTVIGPNGGGKTTLLRCIIGTQNYQTGTIIRKPELRIGYTPQKIHIDRTLPMHVDRFLSLAGPLHAGAREEVLSKVGISDMRKAPLADLSGGEMQRVLLARALLRKPDILILDEPTQGLDQPGEIQFYRLIAELRKNTGAGVLMVSHDLHVVMAESDRVICLNKHVCCSGAPQHVSADPTYRSLFGSRGDVALYQHVHDHSHEHVDHSHDDH